ncbi:MAG: RNA polymerase sigma-70 factor [Bacteroidales bacterium]|nr:RNA polymerase sigma-70 factor [Bacteroidales bacterium]
MVHLESNIFERIKNGDEKAFDYIFDTYYTGLCIFANKYVEDIDLAEDIVQELFVKIWVKRGQININNSLKSYLFQSVNNSCLNHLKHLKIRDNYKKHISCYETDELHYDTLVEEELNLRIYNSIESLPEKCKIIFKLSRFGGLKYKEIAEKLKISIKTVKVQIGKALKTLRNDLQDYLPLLLIFNALL